MFRWYVIQTEHQSENRARHNLDRQGIRNLLPLVFVEKRRKGDGLLCGVMQPLFPGYMFVKIDWNKSATSVLATKGIKDFLARWGDDKAATPIVDEDMLDLTSRLGEYNGWDNVLVTSRPIKRKEIELGNLVQILFGPFRGHSATVSAIEGSRVQVLLNVLGANCTKAYSLKELATAA